MADSFRDTIGTVASDGKRRWLYPKRPKGRLYQARTWFSIFLLAFLFGAPFVELNEQPLLLFNVLERKFVIFGLIFWPQDFYLFVLAAIAAVIGIALFTVVFGRLWCGWACPQTVFMEMVFRKIEYLIEGDSHKQKRLNAAAMDGKKFFKKTLKHGIFMGISFVIGNTLLAYIIGVKALYAIVTSPPTEHMSGFIAMWGFALLFYGIFSRFREQACIMVCPYGRLQSVLLDNYSISVFYDFVRGESRSKLANKKNKGDEPVGDCIDCDQCVTVCPTGIDIRNGTQMECVNCTACIDACNHVMEKVNRPQGLIRYASYDQIKKGSGKLTISTRVWAYSLILVALIAALAFQLINRPSVDSTITRMPNTLFNTMPDGRINNVYSLKLHNGTMKPYSLTLKVMHIEGAEIRLGGGDLTLKPEGFLDRTVVLILPKKQIKQRTTPIVFGIFQGDKLLETRSSTFLGPMPKRSTPATTKVTP